MSPFLDAGGLMKWVRTSQEAKSVFKQTEKGKTLRPMSLQMCHQFLVGSGEYCASGLGVSNIGEDVFSKAMLFACSFYGFS